MTEYTLKAYAKINLGLDVTGKLPNGYHEVKMIMQSVGIYDELTLTKTDSGITIATDESELPTNEDNLIYRAAKLMFDTYSITGGVHIQLSKNIPIAAGMAGGSTDAAATMKGINRLYQLNIPTQELMRISVSIGADVPYCILGGTALAEGIGEILTPLAPAPSCHLLVAKPDINVSTKYVYDHLDASETLPQPDINGIVGAINMGSLQGIIERLGNVLETATVEAYPIISDLKKQMLELGAAGSLMSGSGPTVFGIYTDEKSVQNAYEQIRRNPELKQVFVTSFV